MKHTPGPEIVAMLEGDDPMLICNREGGTDYDEIAANAALIDAAPDLLMCCAGVLMFDDVRQHIADRFPGLVKQIEAAVNKAHGA